VPGKKAGLAVAGPDLPFPAAVAKAGMAWKPNPKQPVPEG